MCMNVREVLDYVAMCVDEYVHECEIGSRVCGDVCGCVCV